MCNCGRHKPDDERFCSSECGRRYWASRKAIREPAICTQCGVEFMALKYATRVSENRFCSARCCGDHATSTGKFRGANNPSWLGGVSTDNMRYRRRQIERHPAHEAARNAVKAAIRARRLVRQPCERCGSTTKIEGHHDDYSKALDVRWLCRRHHVDVHLELKASGKDPDGAATPTKGPTA